MSISIYTQDPTTQSAIKHYYSMSNSRYDEFALDLIEHNKDRENEINDFFPMFKTFSREDVKKAYTFLSSLNPSKGEQCNIDALEAFVLAFKEAIELDALVRIS